MDTKRIVYSSLTTFFFIEVNIDLASYIELRELSFQQAICFWVLGKWTYCMHEQFILWTEWLVKNAKTHYTNHKIDIYHLYHKQVVKNAKIILLICITNAMHRARVGLIMAVFFD